MISKPKLDKPSGFQGENKPLRLGGTDGNVLLDLPDGSRLTFVERWRFALKRLSPKQRESALGRSDKILRGYDDEKIALELIIKLGMETGIPAEWIAFGQTPLQVGQDFEMIPRLAVRPSAGSGALALSDDVDDLVAFRSDWLRRLGIVPRFARAMFSRGDSMEPTIRDGDLLLVDESVDRVVDHGIYVVIYQGMVVVKRIQLRRDGALVLKSDNSLYDEEIVPAEEASDVQIAGRVRWFGRTI